MDDTKLIDVIPLAFKQGLLKPQKEANTCFTPSLNQANFLLYLLARSDGNGLSTSQIQQRSGLHPNTCKTYLRELRKTGLVEKEKSAQKEATWFYRNEKNNK